MNFSWIRLTQTDEEEEEMKDMCLSEKCGTAALGSFIYAAYLRILCRDQIQVGGFRIPRLSVVMIETSIPVFFCLDKGSPGYNGNEVD